MILHNMRKLGKQSLVFREILVTSISSDLGVISKKNPYIYMSNLFKHLDVNP